jgi:DNA-binding response OmpR family regulator
MMEHAASFGNVPPLRGARVLIVEDDLLLRMELEHILRDAGAEIAASCRTLKEGLAAADNGRVAAAILDVRVGTETADSIAGQLASRGTPFIFYTGQLDSDPNLKKWSGHTILSKPARPAAIVAAVANLLR